MSIASRINEMTEHLRNDWGSIDKLGLDITEENSNDNLDKNIKNIAPVLDRFYNQSSNKTDLAKNGVVGRTSQESTTGKNLLPTNASYWETGHYDSSSGEKSWFNTRMRLKNLVPISSSTTYYVSNALNKRLIIREYNANKEFIYNTGSIDSGNTFTTESNTYYLGISIEITYSEYDETASQLFMCNNNVVDKTYEPYTGGKPSPSPDYPQEINNLSGDVEYKVRGKNLFDTSLLPLTKNGITITKNDKGEIVIDGTPNISSGYITFQVGNISTSELTTYTSSIDNKRDGLGVSVGNGNINLPMGETYASKTFTFNYTFTINPTINIRYDAGTFDNVVINPQLEKNTTKTDYEPYISESFPLSLGDIELCDISDYKDRIYSQNGEFYLEKKTDKVVLDGSEGWQTFSYGTNSWRLQNLINPLVNDSVIAIMTTKFKGVSKNDRNTDNSVIYVDGSKVFTIRNTPYTTQAQAQSGMSGEPVYYVLSTTTTTEITQENYPTLYSQLLAIQEFLTKYKINKEFLLDYSSPEIEY